jgi:hypothetical protein
MQFVNCFLSILILTGCINQENDLTEEKTPLVRAFSQTLYLEDIVSIYRTYKTPIDSAQFVKQYINQWTLNKTIENLAQKNKNIDHKEIEHKTQIYKSDLLRHAYIDNVISSYIDTLVTEQECETFYNQNKNDYINTVYKVKGLMISGSHNLRSLYAKIRICENEQQMRDLAEEFCRKKKNINCDFFENNWVNLSDKIANTPLEYQINMENLYKGFHKIYDKDSVKYLIYLWDYKKEFNIYPYNAVKARIKMIILNARKSEIINTIQQDLLNKAISEKQIEFLYP